MFSAPEKNIEQLVLGEGAIVADFGAGSGAYTLAAAKAMHNTGKVYAVEVQKELLTTLQNTCTAEHISNVSFIWGNIEIPGGSKLRDGSCDVVILSNILFQVEDKKAVVEEARRVLRHGGKLLVIDWTASFNNMGPTTEHVFPEMEARKLVEESIFTMDKTVNAGNFHYGFVFHKGLYQENQEKQEKNKPNQRFA